MLNEEQIKRLIDEVENMSDIKENGTTSVIYRANRWQKEVDGVLKFDRLYVNMYWRVRQGRENRSYCVGFIDLKADPPVFLDWSKGYPMCAAEKYRAEEMLRDFCKRMSTDAGE